MFKIEFLDRYEAEKLKKTKRILLGTLNLASFV